MHARACGDRHAEADRLAGGTIAAAVAVLGCFVLPSGAWTLKAADLRADYDPVARHAMLVEQVPTPLATETVNAIGSGLPRVIYGGEPYGALLRGTPIYTNWYNRALQSAVVAAADPDAVTAVLDRQRPDFVVAQPASSDPSERRVVGYAEHRGRRVATIGTRGAMADRTAALMTGWRPWQFRSAAGVAFPDGWQCRHQAPPAATALRRRAAARRA